MIYEVNNLFFSYYKSPMTVRGAKFSFKENQNIMLLASNEMGKTTMLKVLSGFDETYMGSIKLDGKELKSIDDSEKNFSLLLDEPILFERKSIQYNIDYLCETLKINRLSEQEVKNYLDEFQIKREPKDKVSKLSLFEKRKLALIRSSIKKPKILFIDDQLVGLDDESQNKLLILYQKLISDKNAVVMAISDNTFRKHKEFLKTLLVNKVLYLCDAEMFEFLSITEFENSYIRKDVFNFIENFYSKIGFIFKLSGKYYFCEEDKREIELDKNFYQKLNELKIDEGENERVELYSKNEINLENLTDSEFNNKLRLKEFLVFSNLDGKKVF